ncbi:HTH-type transcriptional regulator TtgR [Thalassocella blandensis]|nr:HTH-type transcriptional regulator TtgR [Thalassocella blandensis]
MVRKTKAEALATRNLLLDTAERLFFERGVSKTSLADIAKAAEMTRGAIYWHFKNKYDLLQAMMERVRLPPETLLEAPVENAPLQAMRDYAVKMLRDTATNPRRRRVLSIMMHRCEKNEDEAKALTVRQQAAFIDCTSHIRLCMTTAVKLELLPANLDTDKATTMYLALLFGLISNWLFLPDNFDLEADAEALTDAFFPMLHHSPSLLK